MIKKIAFLGTPEISTSTLRFLFDKGYEIPLVVTGADKKRGRGSALSPSPVSALAAELGLPISHQPKDLLDVEFDLAVVVAYGRLISEDVLSKGLFVNLHFSLLPRWRGAAPMERAILSGDEKTGISVMQLVKELDAGPIYRMREISLTEVMTLSELSTQLSNMANDALWEELSVGESAFSNPTPQSGEPSYAHKLTADDLRINWSGRAKEEIRKVRIGRAWSTFDGKRIKIVSAEAVVDNLDLAPGQFVGDLVATSEGAVRLLRVQPENKREMDASDWLNGIQKSAGGLFV